MKEYLGGFNVHLQSALLQTIAYFFLLLKSWLEHYLFWCRVQGKTDKQLNVVKKISKTHG